jgi:hypothetical protein
LASLVMGSVVLILVPLFFLTFILGTDLVLNKDWFDDPALKLTTIGSWVIVCSLVGLGLFGFIFGIVGMVSGLVRTQPAGLAVAGTLMSLVAMVFAIVLMLATFRLTDELKKRVRKPQRVDAAAMLSRKRPRSENHFLGFGFSMGVSSSLPHSAQLR